MIAERRVGVTGLSGHPHSRPALERCIDVPADVFADKFWGQAPRLTQGRPADTFQDLFSAEAADRLVSEQGLRTPFVRMAKGGEVVAARRFTRSGGAGATIADQIADDRVLALLADGTTLVLQALHRTWPPLMRFGTALAAELGHPVQINAYITPPQNQGFSAHYDNHDVFVLQIAGRKQWRIHEPVLVDPLPTQKWEQRRDAVTARAAQPALIDTVLAPGDALYLPRGYLHSASALGELTIHLTVGVHPLTANDILTGLVEVAGVQDGFRSSLPMGVELADPAVLAPFVGEIARRLADFAAGLTGAQVDQVASGVAARLAEDTRPEPLAPLAQGVTAATLTDRTPIRVRSGLRYSWNPDVAGSADSGEAVTGESATGGRLEVLGRTIVLPADSAGAFTCLLDGDVLTVADLPGLSLEAARSFVLELLREGVVVAATR